MNFPIDSNQIALTLEVIPKMSTHPTKYQILTDEFKMCNL